MKLYRKVILFQVAILAVVMVFFGIFSYMTTKNEIETSINTVSLQVKERLANSLISPLWDMDIDEAAKIIQLEMDNEHIDSILVDYEGEYIGKTKSVDMEVIEFEDIEALLVRLETIYLRVDSDILYNEDIIATVSIYFTDTVMRQSLNVAVITIIMMVDSGAMER